MDKFTIAARAGEGFYKSYVRNIQRIEIREIPEHVKGWTEEDYTFSYKGKNYRVNEHICANAEGEVKYSAKYRYELVEL